MKTWSALIVGIATLLTAGSATAASCNDPSGFPSWLEGVRKEAAATGISRGTIASALGGLSFAPDIVAKDRAQNVFSQSFLQFSDRMVAGYRLQKGAQLIKSNASLFARISKQYGVPAPVLVAFWGLETDFGANLGDLPTLRSLATLAYDCRRPDLFHDQLLAALAVIDRGDLSAAEMKGPWAGELGQVQFLATHYRDFAVDYDGDGRRDLIHSTSDVLASAANLLVHEGWQANQPWLIEVRVPAEFDWQEADLAIQHPVSDWLKRGVAIAPGSKTPPAALPASLLLPMGRKGPAFLAFQNFRVYLEWNQSFVYATTAAYFATRLAGAPTVGRGSGAGSLSYAEVVELQKLLDKRGHDVGKADGKIGIGTRTATKAMQIELGLPADSYPDTTLLQRLRSGG